MNTAFLIQLLINGRDCGAKRLSMDRPASPAVMRGLDPRIHHPVKSFVARWIAGSSPAMTSERSS